ncbi:prepilin-type N-terminal cleavage/methylation domain-containing protein [Enterococcus italicus]|uniref:competence type IV pilus minor pilin ComGF n=1 Tax=Enterococcus italicus TaxID=246144 RepID=UPI002072C949|nr:competence type IV pilus minor pilin ComGF [Enterococcus italicus]MCM6931947.1 prepilin-type N-terminal cleavage/methylation domain-containing protein [Enterococcus italicus]
MRFIRQMSGFTLIEAIVSLFVMLIILAISNQIFGYMQAVQPHLYQRQEQEWSFFTIYLEENFRNCRNVTVTADGIKMDLLNIDEKGNRTWLPLEVKKGKNDRIIFSKNNGTLIQLTRVKRVNYSINQEVLTMNAVFLDGEVKTSSIKLSQIKAGKSISSSN